VNFATAYLDESHSHAGSPILVLAGHVYEREHAAQMDTEWRAVLQREGMEYMRMSPFKDGREPFDKLGKTKRIAIEKELIEIINRHRTLAFTLKTNEERLRAIWAECKGIPGPLQALYERLCVVSLGLPQNDHPLGQYHEFQWQDRLYL
jgi:hypothetical protein